MKRHRGSSKYETQILFRISSFEFRIYLSHGGLAAQVQRGLTDAAVLARRETI